MSRYIDAERLKQILKPSEWGTPDERWVPEHEIGAMLDYFPAADVVEVVRCKDCKHRGYQYRDFQGTEKVVCWKYGYGIQKNANGYCDDWDFRDEKDGEQNG